MRKLFAALGNAPAHDRSEPTQVQFTRFETSAEDAVGMPDANKKFTRFPSHQVTRNPTPNRRHVQPEPISPDPQPERDVLPVLQQSINAMDHLTCEAEIPLSIFRQALPQRFAEMQDDNDEIAAFFS